MSSVPISLSRSSWCDHTRGLLSFSSSPLRGRLPGRTFSSLRLLLQVWWAVWIDEKGETGLVISNHTKTGWIKGRYEDMKWVQKKGEWQTRQRGQRNRGRRRRRWMKPEPGNQSALWGTGRKAPEKYHFYISEPQWWGSRSKMKNSTKSMSEMKVLTRTNLTRSMP